MKRNTELPMSPAQELIVKRLVETVKKNRTFFLTGHEKPDGDTVGSELAFASFLKKNGKRVVMANTGAIPDYCRFLKGSESIKTAQRISGKFDVAVIFECSGPERMGNIIDIKTQAKTVVNIDHHAHYGLFGDINLVNPDASSNSEQLCPIFLRAGHRLSKDEATALYVGLVTDTGRFQQENTRAQSHRVAAHLLETGVNVAEVYRQVYGTRSVSALRLMSRALASLRLVNNDRVAVLRLSKEDFLATGAGDGDTEDVVNRGLLPPSVLVSVFLREQGESVKISLRGKGEVDLCRLAVSLGGGGHKNASGVTLAEPLDRAEIKVLSLLKKVL